MKLTTGLPVERFLQTLGIVAREGKQLSYSWKSLFAQTIDEAVLPSYMDSPCFASRNFT